MIILREPSTVVTLLAKMQTSGYFTYSYVDM